jgi:hypothetical protein
VEAQPAAEQAAATPSEQESAAPAEDEAPPPEVQDRPTEVNASADGGTLWQVQLTDKQLDEAWLAGLLGGDTLVLAVGTDQWVRLDEARRVQSAPEAAGLPIQEPASQTEPWPATAVHSLPGE